MKQISPAKLLAFLRKLYADLDNLEDLIEIECGGKDGDAMVLIDSILSDVGDQILLLPRELHVKPGQKPPTEKEIKAAYKKAHPRA